MKSTLIGIALAVVGYVAMRWYRGRKLQQHLLAMLTYAIEDNLIRKLELQIEKHDGDRQVIRFTGLADTASFIFTIDLRGNFPHSYFVRLGEEESNIRPVSITDLGRGFSRVSSALMKLAQDRDVRAEIVEIA